MGNKGLDQIAAGILERFRATEVCRVGFDEGWIKIVLADQKAKLVAEPRLAVVSVAIAVKRLGLA